MDTRHPTSKSLKITAISVPEAARILASAYGRRVTEEQVRQVAEEAQIIRADGTFSLIEYVAYLAEELTGGNAD